MTSATYLRASVVIPVRNRPDLLERALQSVVAQDLLRTDYEVIVCDDGSTDDIGAIVAKLGTGPTRIALCRQPPLGPAAARNLGIRSSHADIVIFIDSDVIADPNVVRLLVEALESHPEWQGAEAALRPADGSAGILWDAPSSESGGRFHTAGIAYRREALCAVGGFDEEFKLPACEDVELALRILKLGQIGFVPNAIVRHPARRVTLKTHWRWRKHWRYEIILALRYGILAFPGNSSGPFPRIRIAWSALVTLPAGRLLAGAKAFPKEPANALRAALLALFDVICGISALPDIFMQPLPCRKDALLSHERVAHGEVVA